MKRLLLAKRKDTGKAERKSFLAKRKDTGKVKRIEIEDDKQVYDLLEDAIPLLGFDADAGVSIYQEGAAKNISEDTLISDLDDSKMLIIEDTTLAASQKEEIEKKKEDRNQKNMEKAREMKDRGSTKHAPSQDNDFAKRFTEQPGLPTEQHDEEIGLLQDLQQRTSTQTGIMSSSSYSSSDNTELLILRRKMNLEGMNGFLYTITPEDYADKNESTCVERSFSSEQERKATRSKVSTTSDWSSWNAEAEVSGWGVSVSASAGQDRSSTQHAGEKTEEMKRGKTAIVTKTCFHHMKMFKPSVSLSGDAVRDAKKIILEADVHSKGDAIAAFDALYCSYVYTGPFLAGGWFSIVATATSTKAMEFSSLANEASSKIETHLAVGASGWGVSAGAGSSDGTSSTSCGQNSQQGMTSSVKVKITKESVPGNTCNENDLEQKIKDAKNWTVFPVTEVKKVHFIPVHEIMAKQAEEEKDKDLEYVATIIRMRCSRVKFRSHAPKFEIGGIVKEMDIVAEYLCLAYSDRNTSWYRVLPHNMVQDWQSEVDTLSRLLDRTVFQYETKAGDIIDDLESGFGYLLDGFEEEALESFAAIGENSTELKELSEGLKERVFEKKEAIGGVAGHSLLAGFGITCGIAGEDLMYNGKELPKRLRYAEISAREGLGRIKLLQASVVLIWENLHKQYESKESWLSPTFKKEAMSIYARCVALQMICDEFHRGMKRMEEKRHLCIQDNPSVQAWAIPLGTNYNSLTSTNTHRDSHRRRHEVEKAEAFGDEDGY